MTLLANILRRARWFAIAGACVWAWFRVPEAANEGWGRGVAYFVLGAMAVVGVYRGVKSGPDEREPGDLTDE